MNKDASYTYIHMHKPLNASHMEDFCRDRLPADEVYVPPHHRPLNPEDEDDVVPDQHAAFGIQKATQRVQEAAWKDLGLGELMGRGSAQGNGNASTTGLGAGFGSGANGSAVGGMSGMGGVAGRGLGRRGGRGARRGGLGRGMPR